MGAIAFSYKANPAVAQYLFMPVKAKRCIHLCLARYAKVTKQNSLCIDLELCHLIKTRKHSSAASLFCTSLAKARIDSWVKNDICAIAPTLSVKSTTVYSKCGIRNALLKICILPATPEACCATLRGVATPSLGSLDLWYHKPLSFPTCECDAKRPASAEQHVSNTNFCRACQRCLQINTAFLFGFQDQE